MTQRPHRQSGKILYPMAYVSPYKVTHIKEAGRGQGYRCLGCQKEMIARKGEINAHHFAHKKAGEQCDPDNALHETAKAAICQGFLVAQEQCTRYDLKFPCDRCREPIAVDVAIEGAGIATERSEIEGTRSDLVITEGDGRTARVIIEVVVHHDIDPSTEKKYRISGTPVMKVRPSWGNVDSLRKGVSANETLNVKTSTCRDCREEDRLHKKWLSRTEEQLRSALKATGRARVGIDPITEDKFGSFLRADTRRQINQNARKLAELGFSQQSSRNTLFKVQLDGWAIYADLDSTDVMRIWEVNCAPGIYAFPQDVKPPRCRECVLETVRDIMGENGVEIRRYFEDREEHNHWPPEMTNMWDYPP